MLFGILGPVLVHDGEAAVSVPAARQRVLLTTLLLHSGQAVRAETLADIVWDESPPPGAIDTLRTHVMRLRRVLGPRAGQRLVTRYPGYLIDAGEDEVDLLRFWRLCQHGSAAIRAGSSPEASQILTEALALWRGPALADVPSQVLQRDEVPRLGQLRLQAQEWRIDADLCLGRHAELVPELQLLTAEHPLRERSHCQLMLALHRCGRQAEALAAYRRAREVLIEELGAEPGSELRTLHQQILTADPALAVRESDADAAAAASLIPRQLPGPVSHFVGRDQEMAALTEVLVEAAHAAPATAVISAIGGTAGVGKTALAVQWAHRVAKQFPDGQVYVNLRGYDPAQPVTAADALAGFLRALGVRGQDIPADEAERAARYRSLLADKQVLIVLDNASNVEQVRPLLPGTTGCVVVVTSRDSLPGLVARDGAARLELDLLPLTDAVALLRKLSGTRSDVDPAAAEELATQCCRLPLALRVAAELAAARPGAALADLVAELGDQQRRLNVLDAGGDPHTAVRAVFSWSCDHLDADAARAFRLASLHPGPSFDPYAIAAVTSSTLDQARHALDVLARAHLIQRPGRYAMHDLLRAYARELAAIHDSAGAQHEALTLLLDYYLYTASIAMDVLYPAERQRRPSIPPPGTPVPSMPGPGVARAWLDAELSCLVAITAHSAGNAWLAHATRLSVTLYRYLQDGAHMPEALTIHAHARQAARRNADRSAEAEALMGLTAAEWERGRDLAAVEHSEQALVLFREVGDQTGQSRALGNLGLLFFQQGRYQQAAKMHQQALALCRNVGDRVGEARELSDLGRIDERQGRYQEAIGHLRKALALHREVGDRQFVAYALTRLGRVDLRQGHYMQAAQRFRQSLALHHEVGNAPSEAEVLSLLGTARLRQGRYDQAADCQQQALALSREVGDRCLEAAALNGLGETFLATRRPADAAAMHGAALDLTSQTGYPDLRARAHNGLASAWHAAGDVRLAQQHWQEALALYAELGAPEAGEVRAMLNRLDELAHVEP
jgi:DNA-binding SARP family transcriptional activator/Tfp pilus assembly protein PilF